MCVFADNKIPLADTMAQAQIQQQQQQQQKANPAPDFGPDSGGRIKVGNCQFVYPMVPSKVEVMYQ